MQSLYKTTHRTVEVDGIDVFYRSAGDTKNPAIVLLHGVPTSSYMFRNVIEPLAQSLYVVAPDMPGSGFSGAPSVEQYDYTFDAISHAFERLLDAIGVDRFFLYMSDFGTPVGYYLATRHPDRIRGVIVQNGNAHEAGLGPTRPLRTRRSSPSG